MSARQPSLFLSHGAPTLAVDDSPAARFLRRFGASLQRPEAIVLLSAHHDQPGGATLTAAARPATIHDFGGFPPALYALRYPAPGAPDLAREIAADAASGDAGLTLRLDPQRGFDHGAWVPLLLMFPDADIPLLQLSIDSSQDTDYHLRLGRILRPWRERGVLVIGSGGATHNLAEFFHGRYRADAPPPPWVESFSDWLLARLTGASADVDAIRDYPRQAPDAARNHPSAEHFLPLLATLGAIHPDEAGQRIHHSYSHAVLALDMYGFGLSGPATAA